MYPDNKISEIEATGQAVIDPCQNCRSAGTTCMMHPMHPDIRYRKCLSCLLCEYCLVSIVIHDIVTMLFDYKGTG